MIPRRRDKRLLAAALALVLGLAGPAAAQEETGQAETVAEAGPDTAVEVDPDRVIDMILVKVNGSPIFLSELEEQVDTQIGVLRAQLPESEIQAQLPAFRRQVLTALVDERMMLQRADRMGITADANAVDRTVQRIRDENDIETEEEFQAMLDSMGMTLETLRQELRKQIRQNQLAFEEVQRGIFVGEAEIDRYYRQNLDEFSAAEGVRLEQLVFVGGDEMREPAETALQELRAGAALQEVAASHSEASAFPADETFVETQDLNESLAAALPELSEGQFSGPIQSRFGWHLVRVVERREGTTLPLEEVKDAIRQRLTAEKSNERMQQYLAELREETHLEVLAPQFANLEEAWKKDPDGTEETTAR